MDLTPYVGSIVFLHVLGAFMFAAGHGVSMFVVFQARRERDRARLAGLLDLSGWSLGVAGIGMLILFISGIVAGIVLGSFGKAWIWIALVLFVVIGGAMTPIGGSYLRRLRVEHARLGLIESDLPIAELALAAGFSSQAHFTRVFRRLVGTTPAAYRRGRPARRR